MNKPSIDLLIKDPKYNLDPVIQNSAILHNPALVQYFPATRDQWLAAVIQQPHLLLVSPYMNDSEFYTSAFQSYPELILQIVKPTQPQCLTAIKIKPEIIEQLAIYDLTVWMAALARNGSLLRSCNSNTAHYQVLAQIAVNQDPSNVKYMNYVDEGIALSVIAKDISIMRYLRGRVEATTMKRIVTLYPETIRYIPIQSLDLQKIAVENNINTFIWCNPQYSEIVEIVLKREPKMIKFVQFQTIEQAKFALERGIHESCIIPSILEKLNEEKRDNESDQAEQDKQSNQKSIEIRMLELTRQSNFVLTPAQTQLLPQILGSNLDADAKQEAIKLIMNFE
jgi:hypothetical protein